MIPITMQDAMIAQLIMWGMNTKQIIDLFKEHGFDIDRTDIRKGTNLTFWMNITELKK